jgi:Holliday junction resolvase RusA-like endonuclease
MTTSQINYIELQIKPISVNDCWQGRRFKTPLYTAWQQELMYKLPRELGCDLQGELELDIEWGFSNLASDIDNPCKPFIDTLQQKYGFNDRQISKLSLNKKKVNKGEESIRFSVKNI